MNFRISKPREEVMNWIKTTHFTKDGPRTLSSDQFLNLQNDLMTINLVEAPITFPPTYKYNQGTQTFDSSWKQRIPSYTDRILFNLTKEKKKSNKYSNSISQQLKCHVYDSLRDICSSDHKPVYAIFSTTI